MRILVTGSKGYIGNALMHALGKTDHEVFGVDNCGREMWVYGVGGESLTDFKFAKSLYGDFSISETVAFALSELKPEVIVHLASQPSAPFSEISGHHRIWTQKNNMEMMMNLLTVSNVQKLDPVFIVTTTTGIPGAPPGPILEAPMPILAGSSYHISRGFDSANLALAARQWKFRILEMRTAIVYGVHIDGNAIPVTRFDWDYYFGTVVHRFLLSKIMGKKIPIYGKGLQRKPIIALRDVVKSIMNAIDSDIPRGHKIVNQVTECLPVIDIAQAIGGEIEHIPNPRIENEEHQMEIESEKFLEILDTDHKRLAGEIPLLEKAIKTENLPANWEAIFEGKWTQPIPK